MIGTAVAGATAKRLGADAGIERTMTADALIDRARAAATHGLDERSVVVMDEAGMADTQRLAQLVESDERAREQARAGRRSARSSRRSAPAACSARSRSRRRPRS